MKWLGVSMNLLSAGAVFLLLAASNFSGLLIGLLALFAFAGIGLAPDSFVGRVLGLLTGLFGAGVAVLSVLSVIRGGQNFILFGLLLIFGALHLTTAGWIVHG